jgi:MFS family permease
VKARNRKIIYFAGFLFSIPVALTSYINSSFLDLFLNPYLVSVTYISASIVTVIAMTRVPGILTRFGNWRTILFSSALTFFSFIGLATAGSKEVVIPFFILYIAASTFVFTSLDIFIEDFSERKASGGMRGLYLMFLNSAWVVAQLISGSIIAKSSLAGIYLFSAGIVVLFSLIFVFLFKNFRDPEYRKVSTLRTIGVFWRRRNLLRVYLANFILKFFFSWMIIYTPLYLREAMGFEWSEIGIIFSIMLLPFVLLDYPLGKVSDKIGERKLLIFGFFLSAIFTALIPLISEARVFLWAGILFMTRVGAATIETMSEVYFFKSVEEEDDDEISFFRNTTPLSFIIGPALAIPVLAYTPSFKFIFIVLSAVLLLGALISFRLRDIR